MFYYTLSQIVEIFKSHPDLNAKNLELYMDLFKSGFIRPYSKQDIVNFYNLKMKIDRLNELEGDHQPLIRRAANYLTRISNALSRARVADNDTVVSEKRKNLYTEDLESLDLDILAQR